MNKLNENFNTPKRPGVPVYVDISGNSITKDQSYSDDFWSKRHPEGYKEAMMETIKIEITRGIFANFVSGTKTSNGFELDEESKEKLSAYRILADEMGYVIGPFKYNENAGTVEAEIKIK